MVKVLGQLLPKPPSRTLETKEVLQNSWSAYYVETWSPDKPP